MQRAAVAADVERGASDEGAEVGQTKLLGQHDASGGLCPESLACGLGDLATAPASDGPDVSRMRRPGELRASAAASSANASAGQRRKGLPALTCMTISSRRVGHASRGKHPFHASAGVGRFRHLRRIVDGVERRYAEWREQIRLVRHRVSRPQLARPVHPVGVHPAAAGDCVADPARCPGNPRQPRAPRAAVEIDDQVEAPAAQRTREA